MGATPSRDHKLKTVSRVQSFEDLGFSMLQNDPTRLSNRCALQVNKASSNPRSSRPRALTQSWIPFRAIEKNVFRNGPKTITNGQTICGKHFYKFAFKIWRTFSGPFFGSLSGPFSGQFLRTIFDILFDTVAWHFLGHDHKNI